MRLLVGSIPIPFLLQIGDKLTLKKTSVFLIKLIQCHYTYWNALMSRYPCLARQPKMTLVETT